MQYQRHGSYCHPSCGHGIIITTRLCDVLVLVAAVMAIYVVFCQWKMSPIFRPSSRLATNRRNGTEKTIWILSECFTTNCKCHRLELSTNKYVRVYYNKRITQLSYANCNGLTIICVVYRTQQRFLPLPQ